MCLVEEAHRLDKLSVVSSALLAMRSMLMNQQYVLSKVSVNRNPHKARFFVDQLTKT